MVILLNFLTFATLFNYLRARPSSSPKYTFKHSKYSTHNIKMFVCPAFVPLFQYPVSIQTANQMELKSLIYSHKYLLRVDNFCFLIFAYTKSTKHSKKRTYKPDPPSCITFSLRSFQISLSIVIKWGNNLTHFTDDFRNKYSIIIY